MGKFYSPLILLVLLLITALAFSHSKAAPMERREKAKSAVTRPAIPIIINKSSFTPFTLMGNNSLAQNTFQTDTSAVLNVKVYPIPVTDEMNISYHLKKDSRVTITIESIIGSKLFTLFSKRVPAGEQKSSFSLGSRLRSGPYLLRVFVDNRLPITKRILVQ
jgi:hypothetical protein